MRLSSLSSASLEIESKRERVRETKCGERESVKGRVREKESTTK